MKTVGLWINADKDPGLAVAKELARCFDAAQIRCVALAQGGEPMLPHVELVEEDVFFALAQSVWVLGGDGSFLAAARAAAPHGTPLIGVNMGRVGFLSEVEPRDMETAVQAYAWGKYHIEQRMMVEGRIVDSATGEVLKRVTALNEVTVTSLEPVQMLSIQTRINGMNADWYYGDGILVSSPTGSTAYSLSAGGPLVMPDFPCMILTPICVHSLHVRPFVIAADATVCIDVVGGRAANLSVDGQTHHRVEEKQHVEVVQSPHAARLIRFAPNDFFRVLRNKLSEWSRFDIQEQEMRP